MQRIEVNVQTGDTTVIDLTPEEIADAQARKAKQVATPRVATLDDLIAVQPEDIRTALAERLKGKP